jgi:hypothetical protein
MGRTCSTNGDERNTYRILLGRPEGKRPVGRPKPKWVNNIKMELGETGQDAMDWIDLAQDRSQWRALVNTVMYLLVPQNAGKFWSGCTLSGFSRKAQLYE